MRGMRALALLLLAVACTSEDPAAPSASSSSSTVATVTTQGTATAAAPPVTTAPNSLPPAGTVTLRVTDLHLVNSEESDNAFRALIDSAASEVTVVLTGVPSPNRVVFVCPATELERRVATSGCVTPASGEAVKVVHRPDRRGVEVVQVGTVGSGPAANTAVVGDIAITYAPTSREVRLRLPPVARGDAGGSPSFRVSPPGPGAFRATATWTSPSGPVPGNAELVFTVGTNVNRTEGPPGAQIAGNVSPPAEGVLRLRNTGSATLIAPTIVALFP